MEATAMLSDLVAQSSRLPRVPAAAAEAYRSVMQALVVEVTETLAAYSDYREFLHGNPPPLAENHRNHAQFMDEVLTSGRYDLLAVTLPWLYHAYHARGVHYDYFPAELRLWQRAIARALPAEAAGPINAVYDWMLGRHAQFVQLAELRTNREPDGQPAFADLLAGLTDALLASDDARVLALCRGFKDGGASLPELLLHLIYPALQRVGDLWEDGRISVADEHQATAIVNRVLGALYYEETFPDQVRGRALVAASLNQLHEIGAWMVATCLELDGWDVDYLGANVPPDALLQKARKVRPDLIALSIAMAFSLRETRALIAALRAQLPEVKILIGGHAFLSLPTLADDMGADAYLPDCAAAVRWAREQRGAAQRDERV